MYRGIFSILIFLVEAMGWPVFVSYNFLAVMGF